MLNLAVRNTSKLIREKSKAENIRLGRLFTKKDTARLMAEMVTLDKSKSAYTLLDVGAGTGILSAALIERICRECPSARQIFLTCYENNEDFADMLEDNLERIRKKCRHDYDVKLFSTVYRENYLTESKKHYTVTFFDTVPDKYDVVISNPPVDLAEKYSEDAEGVGGISQLKISKAFLFLKNAKESVEENGQLVMLLPTTFSSASALAPLRKEISESLALSKIHLFIARQKNESRAVPTKKSFIAAYVNGERPDTVTVSTSYDSGKSTVELGSLPYGFIVDELSGALTLPKSVEDTKIVKYISSFPETLDSIGLRMSTGLIVDSKCEGLLFTEAVEGTVPLIRAQSISDGVTKFPQPIKKQYLAPVSPSLIQRNKNMILIKRIPAKSDKRFLNSSVYLAAELPQYKYVSTHNKINFIDTKDKNAEMPARLVFGLFALLNSTVYEKYLSIVSKSRQINSKEMRSLPLPPRNVIENIGMRIMALRETTVSACDSVVNPTLHIIER